ncbi:unnamed protein product [Pleuronectes platessa]|uniref:Uncharacterized protein n=1 Tax=Pleuronectes platessa TaxID=8262 RepID=A0A9N7UT29_PLEPL|nr:unnamed protein product [Pleuronectes platessa]
MGDVCAGVGQVVWPVTAATEATGSWLVAGGGRSRPGASSASTEESELTVLSSGSLLSGTNSYCNTSRATSETSTLPNSPSGTAPPQPAQAITQILEAHHASKAAENPALSSFNPGFRSARVPLLIKPSKNAENADTISQSVRVSVLLYPHIIRAELTMASYWRNQRSDNGRHLAEASGGGNSGLPTSQKLTRCLTTGLISHLTKKHEKMYRVARPRAQSHMPRLEMNRVHMYAILKYSYRLWLLLLLLVEVVVVLSVVSVVFLVRLCAYERAAPLSPTRSHTVNSSSGARPVRKANTSTGCRTRLRGRQQQPVHLH